MARLQILELPEGTGDDRPPFVLVVDQYEPTRYVIGIDQDQPEPVDEFAGIAEQIGARGVLVFQETVDIPANDVPLDENGQPLSLKVHIEGEFEQFREQVQAEIRKAQTELRQSIHTPTTAEADGPKCQYCGADCTGSRSWDGGDQYACGSCADWRAKLNQHKAALLDALGMDRTRDWDEIRNAAAGLRRERDEKAAALECVRTLDDEPQEMNAQNSDPASYLHGYRVAISRARLARWGRRTQDDQTAE